MGAHKARGRGNRSRFPFLLESNDGLGLSSVRLLQVRIVCESSTTRESARSRGTVFADSLESLFPLCVGILIGGPCAEVHRPAHIEQLFQTKTLIVNYRKLGSRAAKCLYKVFSFFFSFTPRGPIGIWVGPPPSSSIVSCPSYTVICFWSRWPTCAIAGFLITNGLQFGKDSLQIPASHDLISNPFCVPR